MVFREDMEMDNIPLLFQVVVFVECRYDGGGETGGFTVSIPSFALEDTLSTDGK